MSEQAAFDSMAEQDSSNTPIRTCVAVGGACLASCTGAIYSREGSGHYAHGSHGLHGSIEEAGSTEGVVPMCPIKGRPDPGADAYF